MKNLDLGIQMGLYTAIALIGIILLTDFATNNYNTDLRETYIIVLLMLGSYQLLSAFARLILNLSDLKKVSDNKIFSQYLFLVISYFLLFVIKPFLLNIYNPSIENPEFPKWLEAFYILIVPPFIGLFYFNYSYKKFDLKKFTNT